MDLTPGARFRSALCGAEVVVVRAPAGPVDLRFGGHPALAPGQDPPVGLQLAPDLSGELPMGKRYADADSAIEVLVTRGGTSLLSVGDRPLVRRDPKALPASD